MKLDSHIFVDANNKVLLLREATRPLSACAADQAALSERHKTAVFHYRSFCDEAGKEVLAELAGPLAKAALAVGDTVQGARVEIWHRTEPDFDAPQAELTKADFNLAGVVLLAQTEKPAAMLEAVYALSQNIDAPWNPAKPARSTSVGDVLELQTVEGKQCYGIASLGFCKTAFVR